MSKKTPPETGCSDAAIHHGSGGTAHMALTTEPRVHAQITAWLAETR